MLIEEEKNLIREYCLEMSIENYSFEVKCDLETLLDKIVKCCNLEEINIFMFEIVAVVKSDNEYDGSEQEFMHKLMNKFNFSENKLKEMLNLVDELMDIYKRISVVISVDD